MTEVQLQEAVVALLNLTGWRHMHVRRTIGKGRRWTTSTSVVGWPDLFAYNPTLGRTLAIELKSDAGRLTAEQTVVLDELCRSGVETLVVRPRDLQTLANLLRRKAQAA
jgi:hypothetical protein